MPSDYQKKKLAKKKEVSKQKGGKKAVASTDAAAENGGSDDNEPQTNGTSNEKVPLTYEGKIKLRGSLLGHDLFKLNLAFQSNLHLK